MKLRINNILPLTHVEGPGPRFCIYVQGCDIRCPGCANKAMWDFDGGTEINTEDIIFQIKKTRDKISGITFLGGEPTCQAEALCEIAEYAKQQGLNLLLFSGHTFAELSASENPYIKKLLSLSDLLIDGRFDQNEVDYERPWIGSRNQNYIFLSDVFRPTDIQKYRNAFELRIAQNGEIQINGMGNYQKMKYLIDSRS